MTETRVRSLQDRIGYAFDDPRLLERALTHSSLGAGRADLERLEFLGDRVLGLLIAERLWRAFPDAAEGELAVMLNALVRKQACADAARHFGLAEALLLSRAEDAAGGRDKDAILGDACEALLGALYIDGGLEAAGRLIEAYWTPRLEDLLHRARDAKTELQEWTQARGLGVPDYAVIERTGPDHAPRFTVEARIDEEKPARGRGASKRAAEQAAAEAALIARGVWREQ